MGAGSALSLPHRGQTASLGGGRTFCDTHTKPHNGVDVLTHSLARAHTHTCMQAGTVRNANPLGGKKRVDSRSHCCWVTLAAVQRPLSASHTRLSQSVGLPHLLPLNWQPTHQYHKLHGEHFIPTANVMPPDFRRAHQFLSVCWEIRGAKGNVRNWL